MIYRPSSIVKNMTNPKPKRHWIVQLKIEESFSERLSKAEILEILSFDTPKYVDITVESLVEEGI